jgi:tetratricopeptide (TPR) repeat protein
MDDMRSKKLVIFTTILLPVLAVGAWWVTASAQLSNAERRWEQGEYAASAESYARAARLFFWRTELWEKAGIAAAANGNYVQSLEYFEGVDPLSAQGWAALGFSHFKMGDVSSALMAYQRGLEFHDSAILYEGLAAMHREQKNWVGEMDAIEGQVRVQERNASAHYRLGLLFSALEPDRSMTEFEVAVSLDPQYAPAVETMRVALTDPAESDSARMVAVGRGLGLLQEWDLSLVAFERAIELDEANAEAWAWLGEAKQQTGADGRVELDRALTLDHTSVTVRALRGLYWNRQGKYPQVLAEYLLAAEYDPGNPAWWASIGDAYVKLGDLVSAFDAYQHAAQLAPDESTYWRLLAVFCAENGVHIEDTGLPAAEKAVELAPDDPLALDALGFSYFSTGRFANAELTLWEALELAPEFLPAHIHLAMNYLAQGNYPPAFDELTYVRDADPEGPHGEFAKQLLAQYFP